MGHLTEQNSTKQERFIVGEIYILEPQDFHKRLKDTVYIRAICTGKNDVDTVGFFLDKSGYVFNWGGGIGSYLEKELPSYIDKTKIVDKYPLSDCRVSHMAEFANKYFNFLETQNDVVNIANANIKMTKVIAELQLQLQYANKPTADEKAIKLRDLLNEMYP